MIKVGLTGNIGSGKTLVAEVFRTLGVPVFHADIEARKLFERFDIREKVISLLGEKILTQSGDLNRKAIADTVFANRSLLDQLNRIIHPAVREVYREWCQLHAISAYTLYEAAILFESGHYQSMDKVICVTAPEEIRIQRVMERDHVTREEVERRISNQWPEEKKIAMADFVIRNDGNESVIEQALKIHKVLMLNA